MTPLLLREIADLQSRRMPGALCTIVKTGGSTPLKTGAAMLVRSAGEISGTIGGGAFEHSVIEQARQVIGTGTSELFEHRLVRDHNMCCGGTVHVFIESLGVLPQLYIFGAGHVGMSLAKLATDLAFVTTVIDDRPEILAPWQNVPQLAAVKLLNAEARDAIPTLSWDDKTFVVIATYSHPLDREILRLSLERRWAYCGMIGSLRKVALARRLFTEQRWATDAELDRIDMPIGIAIGAQSPAEIAISIAGRMIEVKIRTKNVSVPSLPRSIRELASGNSNSNEHALAQDMDCFPSLLENET